MMKPCQRCGVTTEIRTCGRYCRACAPIANTENRLAARLREDPARSKERQARYRERHRLEIREQEARRRAAPGHRDYLAQKHSEARFGGLRDAVLQRDDYRCQRCGTAGEGRFRFITVHHVDTDSTHNTMENLITLCRSCHPRTHGPLSEEHRRKIGAGQPAKRAGPVHYTVKSCGNAHPSCAICAPERYGPEWREKQRQSHLGKRSQFTDETRAKMAESARRVWQKRKGGSS